MQRAALASAQARFGLIVDSAGNVEHAIAFNEADRKL